jgi:methionine-rich copper-binding protein CopC
MPCSFPRLTRALAFAGAISALGSAALIVTAEPAAAHAVLIDSVPAPDGHVPAGALAIKFRYNSRIDAPRSKLTLTKPDGSTTRLDSHGEGPDLLEANVTLPAGAYTLHWQVLAIDGHITRGNVPFTADAGQASAQK